MKITKIAILAAVIVGLSSVASAKDNPKPVYKDSYAVGGVCYCDTNFDHGLNKISAQTPVGKKKVTQICADIKKKLGTGPKKGRIPYNDIQCGNGPANFAKDETTCPGRVDIGPKGCNQKGPKWNLAAVYGKGNTNNNNNNASNGNGGKVTASANRNGGQAKLAVDGKVKTRYTTKERQKKGQTFTLDLKSTKQISSVTLNPGASKNDYPRAYQVHVSTNGKNWGKPVASGKGKKGVTNIKFGKRSARFVRITQTGSDVKFWWTIAEASAK